jgi:hypothetical protein
MNLEIAPADGETSPSEVESTSDPLIALEFDNVVGYKLSDAIRDGSKQFPQAHGWGDGVHDGCALTAARVAIEGKGYGISQ